MCHGPEDPSQWATKSTTQRYPGEGFHCHNQGGACVLCIILNVVLHLITFAPRCKLRLNMECLSCLASTRMRRGWRACPSSSTGTCEPSSVGSGSAATRRSPALSPGSVKACKGNRFKHHTSELKAAAGLFSQHVITSKFTKLNLHRL